MYKTPGSLSTLLAGMRRVNKPTSNFQGSGAETWQLHGSTTGPKIVQVYKMIVPASQTSHSFDLDTQADYQQSDYRWAADATISDLEKLSDTTLKFISDSLIEYPNATITITAPTSGNITSVKAGPTGSVNELLAYSITLPSSGDYGAADLANSINNGPQASLWDAQASSNSIIITSSTGGFEHASDSLEITTSSVDVSAASSFTDGISGNVSVGVFAPSGARKITIGAVINAADGNTYHVSAINGEGDIITTEETIVDNSSIDSITYTEFYTETLSAGDYGIKLSSTASVSAVQDQYVSVVPNGGSSVTQTSVSTGIDFLGFRDKQNAVDAYTTNGEEIVVAVCDAFDESNLPTEFKVLDPSSRSDFPMWSVIASKLNATHGGSEGVWHYAKTKYQASVTSIFELSAGDNTFNYPVGSADSLKSSFSYTGKTLPSRAKTDGLIIYDENGDAYTMATSGQFDVNYTLNGESVPPTNRLAVDVSDFINLGDLDFTTAFQVIVKPKSDLPITKIYLPITGTDAAWKQASTNSANTAFEEALESEVDNRNGVAFYTGSNYGSGGNKITAYEWNSGVNGPSSGKLSFAVAFKSSNYGIPSISNILTKFSALFSNKQLTDSTIIKKYYQGDTLIEIKNNGATLTGDFIAIIIG